MPETGTQIPEKADRSRRCDDLGANVVLRPATMPETGTQIPKKADRSRRRGRR